MPVTASHIGLAAPVASSPQLVQAYLPASADGFTGLAVLPPSIARVIRDDSFPRLSIDGQSPLIGLRDYPARLSRSPPGRLISDREWPKWKPFGMPSLG
jgi:hypothetical protein